MSCAPRARSWRPSTTARTRSGSAAAASRMSGCSKRRGATSRRSRTGVVAIHFALYGLPAAIVARFGRRPVLVHFHGPWAEESAVAGERGGIRLRAKRVLERAAYRAGDIHVVHTRAFERLLVERYGISPWTV